MQRINPKHFFARGNPIPWCLLLHVWCKQDRNQAIYQRNGQFLPVLQWKNGHQFALKRNRKLGTKHSAMETCVCGSQDPFLSVRIHTKSPLAAFRVSINSSKMIGIKGSKHSPADKSPLPPACSSPPPAAAPLPSADRSHCAAVPQQLHREQRHQGTGAGACWSCGRKHKQRRKVRLKGRDQQLVTYERARNTWEAAET